MEGIESPEVDLIESKDIRNGRLTQEALTSLALQMQAAEMDEVYGRVAIEVEFKRGVILGFRRISNVSNR